MKKIRVFSVLVLLVSILFIGKVNALPSSIKIASDGNELTLGNASDSYSVTTTLVTNRPLPQMHIKNYNGGHTICISGLNIYRPSIIDNYSSAFSTYGYPSCNNTAWANSSDAIKVGYVINLINNSNGTDAQKFYWMEVATLAVLGKLDYTSSGGTVHNYYDQLKNTTVLNTGLTLAQIKANASNVTTSASLTVSPASLTFTLGDDGYYHSNEITVTSPQNVTVTPSNSKLTFTKTATSTGSKYVFKIKQTDVSNTSDFSVTFKTANVTYYKAGRYVCAIPDALKNTGDSATNAVFRNIQEVTLNSVDTVTDHKEKTISGRITEIKIQKVDDYGNKVKGAKFELKTQAQKNNNQDGIVKPTDANGIITFHNIATGTYYLTEKNTPSGYNKNTKEYKIVVSSTGTITVDGKAQSTNTVKITNKFTVTEISKKSAVNDDEVPGAKLQILDKDKKEISCKIKNAENKLETLEKCSWTSTEEPMSIIGLPAGKYYLVETLAPKGYELNPNAVEFEVKADGKVTQVEMVDQIEVEVPNTLSARSSLLLAVAMVDIALGIGIITYVKKNKIEE